MSFDKNNFLISKNIITKDVAFFLFSYLFLKRNVAKTLIESKIIPPFATYFGSFGDAQAPDTYSHYGDVAMDTILFLLKEKIEKLTNKTLVETYTYTRLYKNGDILQRHKDRFSCEISGTLNLGGDPWPIYIEPDPSKGYMIDNKYHTENTNGVKVDLEPGDILLYKGEICEHWRDKFEGEHCGQVFLHYNDINRKNALKNIYDGRPHLGLPSELKNNE